jgi:HAMP domain-containing protein
MSNWPAWKPACDELGELAQAVTRLVVSFKAALGMLKKRQPS